MKWCYILTVDLVVKNGKLVLPWGLCETNIMVEDGKISGFSKSWTPASDSVIDAGGKYVLPGMVDMHVSPKDPGFPEREDFESGTRAAAAGGVTTVVDMPNTKPATVTTNALNQKKEIASRKALVDYAFLGGAGELSADDISALAKAGVTGFKTFMIARFKELAASDWQMLRNFEAISS